MIKLIAIFTAFVGGLPPLTDTLTWHQTFKDMAACEAARASMEVINSVERMRATIRHQGLIDVTITAETKCVPVDSI